MHTHRVSARPGKGEVLEIVCHTCIPLVGTLNRAHWKQLARIASSNNPRARFLVGVKPGQETMQNLGPRQRTVPPALLEASSTISSLVFVASQEQLLHLVSPGRFLLLGFQVSMPWCACPRPPAVKNCRPASSALSLLPALARRQTSYASLAEGLILV